MATITVTVQSLLNAAQFDQYTVDDGDTVGSLKSTIDTATGTDSAWYNVNFNEQVLDDANTLASYGIVNGSVLGTGNIIAYLPTLQDRQLAKLDLASLDRTASGNPYNTYDINLLPSQYIGNVSTPNPHPDGLIEGRPWVITPAPTPLMFLDANNANSYPGSGITWYDISGSNNDAVLYNGVTFDNTGPNSLVFDAASGQWGETVNNLGSMSTWTVEAWFSTTEANLSPYVTAVVTNEWDYGANLNYTVGTIYSPTPPATIQTGFFNGSQWQYTNGFVPEANTWYHVVGTYDGNTITEYVNGSINSTYSYSWTPGSGGKTRIATRWDAQVPPGDFFPGSIGLVRIYNQALTQTQVNQNFVDTAPTYLPSVLFNFSAFGPPPYSGGNQIEDSSGTFNPTVGFTINNGVTGGSGVAFNTLTTEQTTLLNASPYNNGYVWNVNWGPGSTYASTPVAMYYGAFGPGSLVFWILDPADLTYSTAVSNGTFNFPALFVEGTTPTSFTN